MKRFLPVFVVAAFLATLIGGQVPIGPSGAPSSATPIPNFTANGGLPKWQSALATVKAGTGNAKIVIIGESTSTARGTMFVGDTNDAHSGAWPHQLSIQMGMPGTAINFENNSVVGDSSVGTAGLNAFDTRVTVNGWTELLTPFVPGGFAFSNNDTTAFVFNPNDTASYPSAPVIQTDTIEILVAGGPSDTASITIDTGGAAICTIPLLNVTLQVSTCTTTLGTNTYNVKCNTASAGFCVFGMLHAYNSAQKHVAVFNGAAEGATITEFAQATALSVLGQYQPDLCIIMDIGNDYFNQTPLATYSADLIAVANECKITGDVLFTTGLPYGVSASPLTLAQYQATVVSAASSLNAPVWDSLSTFGANSWANYTPSGLNASCCGTANDTTHYSVGMHALLGATFKQILTQ